VLGLVTEERRGWFVVVVVAIVDKSHLERM
jgi:hypothetical protein